MTAMEYDLLLAQLAILWDMHYSEALSMQPAHHKPLKDTRVTP
jgi:hypothetical protein